MGGIPSLRNISPKLAGDCREPACEIGAVFCAAARGSGQIPARIANARLPETVQARVQRDATFRLALLREAIDCMLAGDIDTGKTVLRDYINATVGFDELGTVTHKSPKSLMRMLGPGGNPQVSNLFAIVAYLQKTEGLRLTTQTARR
jgi:DNA-binding phage protein